MLIRVDSLYSPTLTPMRKHSTALCLETSTRFFPFAPRGRTSYGRTSIRYSKHILNPPSPSPNLVDIGLEHLTRSLRLPTSSIPKILCSGPSPDQVKGSGRSLKEYSTSSSRVRSKICNSRRRIRFMSVKCTSSLTRLDISSKLSLNNWNQLLEEWNPSKWKHPLLFSLFVCSTCADHSSAEQITCPPLEVLRSSHPRSPTIETTSSLVCRESNPRSLRPRSRSKRSR